MKADDISINKEEFLDGDESIFSIDEHFCSVFNSTFEKIQEKIHNQDSSFIEELDLILQNIHGKKLGYNSFLKKNGFLSFCAENLWTCSNKDEHYKDLNLIILRILHVLSFSDNEYSNDIISLYITEQNGVYHMFSILNLVLKKLIYNNDEEFNSFVREEISIILKNIILSVGFNQCFLKVKINILLSNYQLCSEKCIEAMSSFIYCYINYMNNEKKNIETKYKSSILDFLKYIIDVNYEIGERVVYYSLRIINVLLDIKLLHKDLPFHYIHNYVCKILQNGCTGTVGHEICVVICKMTCLGYFNKEIVLDLNLLNVIIDKSDPVSIRDVLITSMRLIEKNPSMLNESYLSSMFHFLQSVFTESIYNNINIIYFYVVTILVYYEELQSCSKEIIEIALTIITRKIQSECFSKNKYDKTLIMAVCRLDDIVKNINDKDLTEMFESCINVMKNELYLLEYNSLLDEFCVRFM